MKLRIATRKSPLALWQANHIKALLLQHHPELVIELMPMVTQGDKLLKKALYTVGGKGLFVKELETALLDARADIAVHSMKDVPMEYPRGLILPVICQRSDPRDAFISIQYKNLQALPTGACVGTSSLRRHCQLKALRPDLRMETLRGNVNTRLEKLKQGAYDAIVLASAGLHRLNRQAMIRHYFSTDELIPAAGQGALGIECRADDDKVMTLISPLNHDKTQQCVNAERAMVKKLEGSCQVPIAAYAQIKNDILTLQGRVGSPDGVQLLTHSIEGKTKHATNLGIQLAEELLAQGAKAILAKVLNQ